MKIDPYKHKERYMKWKENTRERVPGVTPANSGLIKSYISDMENGINIASGSIKGSRSYIRLNTLKDKLIFFSKKFKEFYAIEDITEISEEQLHLFFSAMRKGEIKRQDGKRYISTGDFVNIFRAFWHWHQKVSKKKGIEIPDITADLDGKNEKPKWVYLTEEQVKKLCDNAKHNYRVLMMFLFDSGIRSPTELINIKVSDLSPDCKELHIRNEISKTFGRKIKLMLCSDLLKSYISDLSKDGYIFKISPVVVNRYLRRLSKRTFGDVESPAGQKYSELTMYDFRHISCCYWLPRYKSESALKYRFGWKKSDRIHYYSELLGMKDTISEEDLLIDTTKTEIEKRLAQSERKNEIQQERINTLEFQMKKILELTNQMAVKIQ